MQSDRGFTLVELLVVCVLIGVLASMALISISDFKDKTKTARAAAEIRGLEKDVISYATEKGTYPVDANAVGMENLNTLKDPWGNTYVYHLITAPLDPANRRFVTDINEDFDLYSKGPDGLTDPSILNALDDIIRAGEGSFVDTAAKYP